MSKNQRRREILSKYSFIGGMAFDRYYYPSELDSEPRDYVPGDSVVVGLYPKLTSSISRPVDIRAIGGDDILDPIVEDFRHSGPELDSSEFPVVGGLLVSGNWRAREFLEENVSLQAFETGLIAVPNAGKTAIRIDDVNGAQLKAITMTKEDDKTVSTVLHWWIDGQFYNDRWKWPADSV